MANLNADTLCLNPISHSILWHQNYGLHYLLENFCGSKMFRLEIGAWNQGFILLEVIFQVTKCYRKLM